MAHGYELGKKKENKTSRLISVDGRQEVKGKEEFLHSCSERVVCTEYEELL